MYQPTRVDKIEQTIICLQIRIYAMKYESTKISLNIDLTLRWGKMVYIKYINTTLWKLICSRVEALYRRFYERLIDSMGAYETVVADLVDCTRIYQTSFLFLKTILASAESRYVITTTSWPVRMGFVCFKTKSGSFFSLL